jgi:PilZ domain-containing protein
LVDAEVPSLGVTFQATIRNISRSGIRIISPKWLGRGSIISIGIRGLEVAAAVNETQLEGRVAYCLSGEQFSILGIVFNEVITESAPSLFRTISILETQ